MLSHRCTLSARVRRLAVAWVCLGLFAFAAIAHAEPLDGAIPAGEPTPAAPSFYPDGASGLANLPPLFPSWNATPAPPSGPPSIHATENILVLGMDARAGGKMWRTDTIMVAAVDAARKEVGLLSIPRDLWVDIPGYGEGRINIVDFVGENRSGYGGGPALMNQVLQSTLGIETQHWVRIRQEGLVDLVDAMGGITITLDCPFIDKTPDPQVKGQYEYLMLPAGPVFLQGETAKKFVTYRYASTDFSRARRQQQVIWAIRDRALELDVLPRIGQLWVALADTFQTDLLIGELVELAALGSDLRPEQVHGLVLSRQALKSASIGGSAVLVVADPELLKTEVDGVFASRPIAELGRSATGRCAGTVAATP